MKQSLWERWKGKIFGYDVNALWGGFKVKANLSAVIIRAGSGEREYIPAKNVNCTSGLNAARRQLYDASYTPAFFNNIAVSSGSGFTPAAGDTTLAGEATLSGLARGTGSYTGPANTNWQLVRTMTYSGANAITLTGSAVFDASSGGNIVHEALYTATAILNLNDQIQNTWSGSLS